MTSPSKKRYDARTLMKVSVAFHRQHDAKAVRKMEELSGQGKSRAAYVREAVNEKIAREEAEEGKEK